MLREADEIIAGQLDELNRHSRYCYHPTDIGREFGISGNDLNSFLKDKKIIEKRHGCYHLKDKYLGQGLTAYSYSLGYGPDGKRRLKMKLLWTEAGREFIRKLIKN